MIEPKLPHVEHEGIELSELSPYALVARHP